MKVTCRIENGNKVWRNEKGQIHRKKGPAIERSNGTKEWWQNNLRHRVGGPAIEYANKTKEWWQNDRLHRLDGAAIEYFNGNKGWWICGDQYSEEEFHNITKVTIEGKNYILIPVD
jgi:hypothetical protein